MSIPERTVTIAGVFAEDATTTIPTPPVPGISYRDTSLTPAEAKAGWPFKEIVDSSQFNQALYEYSTISQMIEKYGFLPWSANTDYVEGSYALGTDGTIYRAVQDTGPSTTAFNPVNDTTNTYWETWLDSMDLMVGDIKSSVRTANHGSWILCNGQAISRTTYSKLFGIIGTNFGAGDGSTTFNVPDYRGKFLRGLGGNSAGNMQTTQAESLPPVPGHYHFIAGAVAGGSVAVSITANNYMCQEGGGSATQAIAYRLNGSSTTPTKGRTSSTSVSSGLYNGSHVTPINQAVNYFIRAK